VGGVDLGLGGPGRRPVGGGAEEVCAKLCSTNDGGILMDGEVAFKLPPGDHSYRYFWSPDLDLLGELLGRFKKVYEGAKRPGGLRALEEYLATIGFDSFHTGEEDLDRILYDDEGRRLFGDVHGGASVAKSKAAHPSLAMQLFVPGVQILDEAANPPEREEEKQKEQAPKGSYRAWLTLAALFGNLVTTSLDRVRGLLSKERAGQIGLPSTHRWLIARRPGISLVYLGEILARMLVDCHENATESFGAFNVAQAVVDATQPSSFRPGDAFVDDLLKATTGSPPKFQVTTPFGKDLWDNAPLRDHAWRALVFAIGERDRKLLRINRHRRSP